MRTLVFLLLASIVSVYSQTTKHLTLEDGVLGYYKGLYPEQKQLQFLKNEDRFAFIEDQTIYIQNENASALEKTNKALTISDLKLVVPTLKRMPYQFPVITANEVVFTQDTITYTYNYINKQIAQKIAFPAKAENTDFNFEANAIAYTLDNNLFIATITNSEIPVTQIGDKNIVSGQAIARSEFGITKGTFWSPKGTALAFYQKDETHVTNYPLVDITTTPATLNNIKYPMNDMGSEIAKVGVYNLQTKDVTYLDINTSDEHYLTNLSWSPDEKYVFLAEINRAQNHMWFTMYNAHTGKKIKTLFEEKNEKWVEPEHTAVFLPKNTSRFLWISERDGFNNLYLYDLDKGFIKQLTDFNWVIKEILGFDASGKNVLISGTGDDPRETKVFSVNLKNGKTTQLTPESGTHNVTISDTGNYMIDSYTAINIPNITKIKSLKTGKENLLFTATNPLTNYTLGTTEFVTISAKDGTPLYGRIIKPAHFDSSKKYPVLVYVYGGPHAQLVTNTWLGGSNLWMQWLAAEKDYIVFTLDNRGSENRGFAFESVIHRHVGDHEMEDQLAGVSYLKSLPYVNANRLAIHGWSFGGFMTNSLMLRHPGVFTTAVAGGPVTDWKWYEVMYGERYMDRLSENPEGFNKSRVHNYVQNLDGKLLEIIGSVDPVVVPQHTMTLLKSFIEAKKQVDFFTYPMHPHNVRGIDRVHLMQKVLDYVLQNNQ